MMQRIATPMRFERILVLIDTRALFVSASAYRCLDRVTRLAMEHGASLTLCDVLEAPPPEACDSEIGRRLQDLREQFARDKLERLAAPVRGLLPVAVEVWSGTPFLVVTRQVLRQRYDLVVHFRCLGDAGLGPDGMHLARKCPCPLWIMDAACAGPYRNIVVAVDRDIFGNSANASTFALQLAHTALLFGRLEGARVSIVHAWQVFGAEFLRDPRVQLGEPAIERYVAGQRDNHARWLNDLRDAVVDASGGADGAAAIATQLIEGPADEAVAGFVDSSGADLLVMGTVGVTNVPGLFIGNTAESILGRVRVPILALKPPGFHSPVRVAGAPRRSTRTLHAQERA